MSLGKRMRSRREQVKDRKVKRDADGERDRRVFLTRPIAEPAMRRLAAIARVDLWDDEMPPPPAELRARARQADGVLSMVTDRFDAAMIRALPRLRAISNLAVGVDNIDLAAATRAGIAIGHTPGILTETTADLAFALLMAAARRIAEGDRYVRGGRWRTWGPKVMLGRDIHGATLGIIGWGAIGQAMARRAAGFGMRVLGWSRTPREVPGVTRASLETLLSESDFVSLHVALADETRGLLDAAAIARMKPGAILVNTTRGGVLDEDALVRALRDGPLAAAALDVFEREPLPPSSPLLTLPNVVLTPHIGSASIATRTQMAELAVANLLAGLEGRPLPHAARG